MSQVETIYKFLRETENRAADQALLLGLDRAEESCRKVLLETAVQRGQTDATAAIIRQFHTFDSEWQESIIHNPQKLAGGLRIAAQSGNAAVRKSVITIIEQTQSYHLADVIVEMLGDSDCEIGRRAGATLINFSRALGGGTAGQLKPSSAGSLGVHSLRSALAKGLQSYPRHQRMEAVLASMIIVSADDSDFWQCFDLPHDEVTEAVVRLLLTCDAVELAGFCVGALKRTNLRAKAARAISVHGSVHGSGHGSGHGRAGYIIAIAHAVENLNDPEINKALQLIHNPVWFRGAGLPLSQMHGDDLAVLFNLVTKFGVRNDELARYLCKIAEYGSAAVVGRVIEYLTQLPEADRLGALQRALGSSRCLLAELAQKEIIRLRPTNLHQMLIRQLGSHHEPVRETAARACKGFAFKIYWKRFDRLERRHRIAAGQAVFKIDPDAEKNWLPYFEDRNPENRLKAIRIARLLDKTDIAKQQLMQLAQDRNRMVRSCAVAALGQMHDQQDVPSTECLIHALCDKDQRVQANAVEAVEQRDLRQAGEIIARLTQSDNSRIRANAIKAQLSWKVDSAQSAIRQMVSDRRSQHRRSARWLVDQIQQSRLRPREETKADTPYKPFDITQLEQIYAMV
ncbi:MAG: HEAT repeat domain-containing protein [Sedimentisphaerales bacterium]|nr:HEAT repeat domain-containing protein [Sedimentisphaerales bacterium]